MPRTLWPIALEPVVQLHDAVDAALAGQGIRRCKLHTIRQPLVESEQQRVVNAATARRPESDTAVRALIVWIAGGNLQASAFWNNRRLHAVYPPLEAVEIDLAKQCVDEDAPHIIRRQDHALAQLALDAEVHLIATLHRILARVQLRG